MAEFRYLISSLIFKIQDFHFKCRLIEMISLYFNIFLKLNIIIYCGFINCQSGCFKNTLNFNFNLNFKENMQKFGKTNLIAAKCSKCRQNLKKELIKSIKICHFY